MTNAKVVVTKEVGRPAEKGGITMKVIELNEITTLEISTVKLNDARIIAIEFIQAVEVSQRLNKPIAVRQLRRSLMKYEAVVKMLQRLSRGNFLQYYYADINNAAREELEEVKQMFQSVLNADNVKFNNAYQRYLSLLK